MRHSERFAAVLACVGLALSGEANAAETITRAKIIELARPAIGHAYHWGHGDWTQDGSNVGSCTTRPGSSGCPECDPVGQYGADCSGFVAKAWQVPKPSPVEQEGHPYTTEAFANSEIDWKRLPKDRSDIQRGDAFTYREVTVDKEGKSHSHGHIMLVDKVLSSGKFQVIEAKGCKPGIQPGTTDANDHAYIPIRRNDLDEEACAPNNCSEHGKCKADSTCECNTGYAGDHCERCLDGLIGYPNCVAGTCPEVGGSLKCGSKVKVSVGGGVNRVTDYPGCGASGLAGTDRAYPFVPLAAGHAKITLTGSSDVSGLLLRNECDPATACVSSSSSKLEFDYAIGEPYYLILDTQTDKKADVEIRVECQTAAGPWIGTSCVNNGDCTFSEGRCYLQAGQTAGFCTKSCTKSCPDLPNTPSTFCIADPAATTNGICVPKAEAGNNECASVPGTASSVQTRFKETAKATVCVPSDTACLGIITGRVLDSTTDAPIGGATLKFKSAAGDKTAQSKADGTFELPATACGAGTLSAEAKGFQPASVPFTLGDPSGAQQQLKLIPSGDSCQTAVMDLNGFVKDGGTGLPLEGAVIEIHAGNDAKGKLLGTFPTDTSGAYSAPGIPGGYYTLVVTATGYLPGTPRSVSLCAAASEAQPDIFLLPNSNEPIRISLQWSAPDDLDLHLQLPNGNEVFFDECAGSLEDFPYAHLDFDHRSADGAEGIVIRRLLPGTYTVFIHNYSAQNAEASADWSKTNAVVELEDLSTELRQRFTAPLGNGHFWDVLSFEGGQRPLSPKTLNQTNNSRKNSYDEYAELCRP